MNWWVCDLCFPNSTEIGMIAPGYALVREKGRYKILGGQGHRGDYIYSFRRKPVWDPDYEALLLPDDEAEPLLADNPLVDGWIDRHLCVVWNSFTLPAYEGYYFVNRCVEAGFCPEDDNISYWLINKCALLIDLYEAGARA